ncbi:alpha/beta hydrolase [Hymenobacter sp.]|uniref:alpha/beta fold hydrolase n=1 Tax=Hymenobacter sp. TaxID=1898978 RepID=UPI00286BE2AC|nr:alpha/beta hydrolase [Hymenobacter sp.]
MNKTLLLFIALLLLHYLAYGQTAPVRVDTTVVATIGGMRQVLTVKGHDRANPLLLYVHGAAGSAYSLSAAGEKLTSQLQEYFVVVLWDQRGYGQTAALNASPQPSSLPLLAEDTQEVVAYCLKAFGQPKLYLAGHSLGSVLGSYVAQRHPELLYALIEMSPPVDGIASQKMGLALLQDHFKQLGNQRAVAELATVKLPARDFESLFTKYVWQTAYDGQPLSDTARAALKPALREWMGTPAAALSNEVFELNFFRQFPAFKCPVYFFVGRKDIVTNARLTEAYFHRVHAPRKQLFWFEQSAHGLPETEPGLMQNIIIHKILPLTQY